MINKIFFKELIKRGYSFRDNIKTWDISDAQLIYLTPELGKGFLEFSNYKPYWTKVIETEFDLLKANSKKILELIKDKKFNLVDLGCGNGKKAADFIRNLGKEVELRYCPVDVNDYFVDLASKEVGNLGLENVKDIKPFKSDFRDVSEVIGALRNFDFQKNVLLFLGETISQYEVNELLYEISNTMMKGDVIVIGNGYRIGDRFEDINKYKDKSFDKWFFHLMKELGFNEDEIEYDARFAYDRLEFFYKIKKDKEIECCSKKISFKKGDEIIVATQYKYYEKEWIDFFKLYFCNVDVIKDEKKEYAFFVCEK